MNRTTGCLVSIVTVCRNASETLERTIISALGQSYPHFEYIIIDGGSLDGTVDVIRRYESSIAYWISEPDQGISDAFNKGISHCTGEWIGILNADDWYEPETVANILGHAGDADVVHGALAYWQDGTRIEVVRPNQALLESEMTINHPTCFIRRKCYEKHGNYRTDFRYAMDYELLLRLYKSGARFNQLDLVLANMSLGGVSDTHWERASDEVCKAQILNGEKKLIASLRNTKRKLRKKLGSIANSLGLQGLVNFYKRHFSIMPKSR